MTLLDIIKSSETQLHEYNTTGKCTDASLLKPTSDGMRIDFEACEKVHKAIMKVTSSPKSFLDIVSQGHSNGRMKEATFDLMSGYSTTEFYCNIEKIEDSVDILKSAAEYVSNGDSLTRLNVLFIMQR